jgi:hypothetical protein
MINNFELIKSLLEFPNDDIYYHLQILRRGKDHSNLSAANRVIKAYFINQLESIDYLKDEIIGLCEYFGARAYINLAPKSVKKTAALQMKYLAQRMYEGDFKKIWKSWNTCAGEIKGEEARWVVDVDSLSSVIVRDIINCIHKIQPENYFKVKTVIPTKNGFHIISEPFNLQQFKEIYPDIDVHKNNPTILYIPNNI